MTKKALYPGSFDPITKGHMDIIVRGIELFDRVVVGIGTNLEKKTLFSTSERMDMIRESLKHEGITRVEVKSYEGLTAKFAEQINATAILRGLRAVSDFEYEMQMALANRKLFPNAETVFLTPSLEFVYLNSRTVKIVARLGGDFSHFVPKPVIKHLAAKFSD